MRHAAWLVQTPRMASYPALVDEALALAGFGAREEFRGHRTEIDFPAFPCDVRMILDIGPRS